MAAQAAGAGASLLGGILSGKGAKEAAKTQAAAYQSGIDEQRRQFNISQGNFAPFLSAGTGALSGVLDLLGLHGGDVQTGAIDALKSSPGFTVPYNTGVDTILQNASATGGLRGGDTQNGLATFGGNLLVQRINDQLGALEGLVNNGLGATNNLSSLGANTATNISNLLGQKGMAQGAVNAAPYSIWGNALSQAGGYASGGGFGGGSTSWYNPGG